jgi:hypothetical protein
MCHKRCIQLYMMTFSCETTKHLRAVVQFVQWDVLCSQLLPMMLFMHSRWNYLTIRSRATIYSGQVDWWLLYWYKMISFLNNMSMNKSQYQVWSLQGTQDMMAHLQDALIVFSTWPLTCCAVIFKDIISFHGEFCSDLINLSSTYVQRICNEIIVAGIPQILNLFWEIIWFLQ